MVDCIKIQALDSNKELVRQIYLKQTDWYSERWAYGIVEAALSRLQMELVYHNEVNKVRSFKIEKFERDVIFSGGDSGIPR